MKKHNIKTSKKDIINYYRNNNIIDDALLNFDWCDANNVCWNCGKVTKYTQRCHIIGKQYQGNDTPSNYVLLCHTCHENSPDMNNKYIMWDWIKSNKNKIFQLYNMHNLDKAAQQIENKYKINFISVFSKFPIKIQRKFYDIGYHPQVGISISSIFYMLNEIYREYKECD